MANEDKPQKQTVNQDESVKSRAATPTRERPFDAWLQKQLHAMYDEIASEPLPSDLLNLIDKDASNSKK
jgi:hypothetical protein